MSVTLPNGNRVLTTPREAELATTVLESLSGAAGVLTVERDGSRTIELPPELGHIIQHVLKVMSDGGSVTVSALPDELTTTSAAALLGVSRPTVLAMVRDGKLPAHKVGSHTRLKTDDVLAQRAARRARERAAFEELRDFED